MTNEALLERLLAKALQKRGEDGSSVKALRQQLASLRYFKKVKPLQGTEVETFHIGARGEDLPEEKSQATPEDQVS